MQIVIVGDGKVGAMLTDQLSKEGHDIVVIDTNSQVLQHSQETFDVMVVNGNGASMKVLQEARADTADLLIAATSSDEINILCCITAKKLGCRHTIARVRNPEYDRQLELLKAELGLSMTINPEATAAREIYHILQFPSFINRDSFAKGRVEIVELKIKEDSPIIGKRLRDFLHDSRMRVVVCAVERGDDVVIPDGEFVVRVDDILHVTAETQNLTALIRYLGIPKQKVRDVVIVGGSRIGFYLAQKLLLAGVTVKIIESDYDRCRQLSSLLPKALIIHGDGGQQQLLAEEISGKADAIVSLLNIDEVNLVISMYAKHLGVPHVIAKVDRMEFRTVYKAFGVESLISPKHLICNDILRYVRAMDNTRGAGVNTLYRLVGDRVEALEFTVTDDTRYLGVPLREVPLDSSILIACIRRGSTIRFPTGDDCIKAGDSVIIVTTVEKRITALDRIFR